MSDPYRRLCPPSRLGPRHAGRPEVQVSHALFDNLRDQAEPSTELLRYDLDGITVRAVDDLPAGLGHVIVWPDCSCADCVLDHGLRELPRR